MAHVTANVQKLASLHQADIKTGPILVNQTTFYQQGLSVTADQCDVNLGRLPKQGRDHVSAIMPIDVLHDPSLKPLGFADIEWLSLWTPKDVNPWRLRKPLSLLEQTRKIYHLKTLSR